MKKSTISQLALFVIFALKAYDLVSDLSIPTPQWRLSTDIAILICSVVGVVAERRAAKTAAAAR